MLKLYSTGCPKCKVLKTKLIQKNIEFEEITDINLMQNLGITTLPILEVENKFLQFVEANKYINNL